MVYSLSVYLYLLLLRVCAGAQADVLVATAASSSATLDIILSFTRDTLTRLTVLEGRFTSALSALETRVATTEESNASLLSQNQEMQRQLSNNKREADAITGAFTNICESMAKRPRTI